MHATGRHPESRVQTRGRRPAPGCCHCNLSYEHNTAAATGFMMSRPVPDHYAVLHVSCDATPREIARAYRALMRRHHPDVATGEAVPAELERIMQAFSVLRDPQRRRAYDREAARARKSVPPDWESGPQEHSEGDAREARPRAERRNGRPQVIPVRVVRRREPPFRATPVRWESGPWA